MVKASLLRISAQKYATGLIKTGDYLAYRRELLDAIDNDEPLPELPDEWVHLQGNQSSPELQSLMIQMHEKDETTIQKPKDRRKLFLTLAVLLVLLAAFIAFLFISPADNTPTAKENSGYQSENPFIQSINDLMEQENWQEQQLKDAIKAWQALSPMERIALKREQSIQRFKQLASAQLNESRASSGDSQKTQLLYQIISELN